MSQETEASHMRASSSYTLLNAEFIASLSGDA